MKISQQEAKTSVVKYGKKLMTTPELNSKKQKNNNTEFRGIYMYFFY